jgi:hypothetical protein
MTCLTNPPRLEATARGERENECHNVSEIMRPNEGAGLVTIAHFRQRKGCSIDVLRSFSNTKRMIRRGKRL